MSDAAARLRGTEQTADAGVSVGGTWQRKVFSPTLWIVTASSIHYTKLLDVAILSKSCKGCKKMPLLIPLILRHGSYLIIVILIIPVLPLEWRRNCRRN